MRGPSSSPIPAARSPDPDMPRRARRCISWRWWSVPLPNPQPARASEGPPGWRSGSALPACWPACWPPSPGRMLIREARPTPTPRPWDVKRWTSEAAEETQASKESAPSERRACERRRSSSRTIARGSEGRSSWRTISRPCRAVVRQWIFFTSSPGWYSRMVKNSSPTGVGARGRGVPSTEWGLAEANGGRTSIAGNTRRKLLASGRSGARARPNGSVTTVEPGPIS